MADGLHRWVVVLIHEAQREDSSDHEFGSETECRDPTNHLAQVADADDVVLGLQRKQRSEAHARAEEQRNEGRHGHDAQTTELGEHRHRYLTGERPMGCGVNRGEPGDTDRRCGSEQRLHPRRRLIRHRGEHEQYGADGNSNAEREEDGASRRCRTAHQAAFGCHGPERTPNACLTGHLLLESAHAHD